MSQGFPLPLPQRLFDADGAPGAGFKVYTYVGGTSTPLQTYSDAALTSANPVPPNPIVADASGYFRMFVAESVVAKIVVYNASDVLQFTLDNVEAMPDTGLTPGSVTAVPAGGILAYGGSAAPTGFLLCDGSLVSRGTYATLFTAIGTTYGAGDGSTTFALPDLRGRFPLGKAAAGTGSVLGETGGAIDHVHTGPSHTHVVTVPRDGWGEALNTPQTTGRLATGYASGTGADASQYQATADTDVTSAAGGTGNTGTANPPYLACNYIIKT